jgi:hypothetical protein
MTFPTSIEAASYYGVPYNNLSTTLTQEASASDTTIYVTSTANFGTIGWFAVDDEIIYHTGSASGSFTGCTRGADNTTAAVHLSGATVSLTFPAIMWTRAIAEVRAALTKVGTDSDVNTASVDYLVKNTNPNNVTFSHASGIKLDVITEKTATTGVTIDGVLIKDSLDTSGIVAKTGAQTIAGAKTFSDGVIGTPETYTPAAAGTATLDLALGNEHRITMPAGNITIAISNATNGQKFIISILQDGTGSRTVTWFTTIRWAGGSAPTLTTTASKRDIFGFIVTGTGTYDGCVVMENV